jgi:glycerophosphoryl diester phosphodiesterase
MIFLLVIIALVLLVMPFPKFNQFRWLRQHHAHRGLYDELHPENTLGAFEIAISEGLGIECDVRLSKDDELIVVHDPILKRLCQRDDRVDELTFEELQTIKIANSVYSFINLKTLLDLVDGQVPIMIEIKPNSKPQQSVDKLYELLVEYEGNVSVISFDPRIVAMSKKKKMRDIPVGQIIEVFLSHKSLPYWQRWALTLNVYQRISRADFVSIHLDLFPYYQWMTWFGVLVGVWTIKSPKDLQRCRTNNVAVLEKEALI